MASMAQWLERPMQEEAPDMINFLDMSSFKKLRVTAVTQCEVGEKDVEGIYPATALQMGLIAMTASRPRQCKARVACTLQPDTDIDAFKRSWEHVVELNGILRTRFIASPSKGTWQVVIREGFEWDQAQSIPHCIRACDLVEKRIGDRLVHAYIITSDVQDASSMAYFVLVMHHAVCDQWTIRLLMDQVSAIYKTK
jgi:hypothetical protein